VSCCGGGSRRLGLWDLIHLAAIAKCDFDYWPENAQKEACAKDLAVREFQVAPLPTSMQRNNHTHQQNGGLDTKEKLSVEFATACNEHRILLSWLIPATQCESL